MGTLWTSYRYGTIGASLPTGVQRMHMLARGISLTALLSMLLAVLAIAPAVAQQANPYEETAVAGEAQGPESAQPGVDATFWAAGFQPGTTVAVTLSGVLSGAFTVGANAEGVATYVATVPCDAASGTATITFEGAGDEAAVRTSTTDFTVTANPAAACPAPATDEAGLAATGGEFTNGAVLAVVALLIGAGFLVAGRRRAEESVDA